MQLISTVCRVRFNFLVRGLTEIFFADTLIDLFWRSWIKNLPFISFISKFIYKKRHPTCVVLFNVSFSFPLGPKTHRADFASLLFKSVHKNIVIIFNKVSECHWSNYHFPAPNCIKQFHWTICLFWPIRFGVTIVSRGNNCNAKPDLPEST